MNVIKKVFFIALMICTLSVVSNAATGKINTDGARMRREPNTTSDVLTIVYSGETVEIIEKKGEWYKVKYGEHQGYIREDLMQVEEQKPEIKPEPEPEEKPEQEDVPEEPETTQGEKQARVDMVAKILPSFSASNVIDLKQGEKVVVTGQMNKWSCITVSNKTAWVLTSNLEEIQQVEEQPEPQPEPETETEPEPEVTTKTMYISVSAAVLRLGASTSSDAILEMHRGDSVEVLSEEEDWCKINYNGQEGYVAKRLLSDSYEETHRSLITQKREGGEETVVEPEVVEVEKKEATASSTIGKEVVAYAKQFLGSKYVYGGAGPSSFDCSGFTKYVYANFGISLTHSAVAQASNGTYVEKENLQVGDLVIFRDWDNSSIGHCGIYIGGGNFIHAANSRRGVVTDTLNSGYYYERYVSARRLF